MKILSLSGETLFKCDTPTIKETLIIAVKSMANLSGANLYGAYLSGANLSGADLSGANLYGAKNADLAVASFQYRYVSAKESKLMNQIIYIYNQ